MGSTGRACRASLPHTRVLAYFDSVWGGGCGWHVPHVLPHSPLPHARVDSECKRWNLEHVVLDLFSHFTVGKVQWLSYVVLDLFSHIQTGKIQWLFVSCRGSRSSNSPFALSRLANLTHAVGVTSARVHVRVNRVVVVSYCFSAHPFYLCNCCVHSSRFSPVPSLALRMGQMTNATAINAVTVLEDVCAGTTRSGACGSI